MVCLRCFRSTSKCKQGSRNTIQIMMAAKTTPPMYFCASTPDLYKCTDCNYKTPQKVHLYYHFKIEHSGYIAFISIISTPNEFQCKKCTYPATTRRQYIKHIKNCDRTKPVKWLECAMRRCNYIGESDHHLQRHIKRQHPSRAKLTNPILLKCPLCPYKTRRSDTFEKHIYKHKLPNEADVQKSLEFECPKCDFKTKQMHKLAIHDSAAHVITSDVVNEDLGDCVIDLEKGDLECSRCDYLARNRHFLKMHIKTAHLIGGPKFVCPHCPHQSSRKNNLKAHVQRIHDLSNKDLWMCGICGNKFSDQYNLKQHMNIKHTNFFDNITFV